ncbi:non-histone chromosomal protein HMG-14 isoform X1 [Numenius arquata]|uniref:non-histone chromosomal protein HMG-14 isoform X1 n=1 Tax=Numenius arquata TaxID=31919 RepID=UPI003D30C79F
MRRGGGFPARRGWLAAAAPGREAPSSRAGGAAATATAPGFAGGRRRRAAWPCRRERWRWRTGRPLRSRRGDRRGCRLNPFLPKQSRSQKSWRQRCIPPPFEYVLVKRSKVLPGNVGTDPWALDRSLVQKQSYLDVKATGKSEDKKAQSKGKKGPKGKQTEETNQEQTKDNVPAENGEAKSEETPASDAAVEKEAKSE